MQAQQQDASVERFGGVGSSTEGSSTEPFMQHMFPLEKCLPRPANLLVVLSHVLMQRRTAHGNLDGRQTWTRDFDGSIVQQAHLCGTDFVPRTNESVVAFAWRCSTRQHELQTGTCLVPAEGQGALASRHLLVSYLLATATTPAPPRCPRPVAQASPPALAPPPGRNY